MLISLCLYTLAAVISAFIMLFVRVPIVLPVLVSLYTAGYKVIPVVRKVLSK